ncbi:adenylate/guanylate cyclase domain-containing protein [Dyadobacter psychrotolerans]|uniref:Adenylate/guanylate cyclase domain-containing protein n=1 Tax=Dyadobacter psychrotolerans TaxID=2541721 RepID=A0A4R5D524_9BACT|nr:adenylate/guanylate cyclase domain-containing protein [Dyadobacter psychrotolerans]TDE08522.1 adenylate/guanylate cyclase domain-containing protein [Dyadobacter psychrotolerans]
MAVKYILKEVEEDIEDVIKTSFKHAITKQVPNSNDSYLTFERDSEKRGKIIETCVLYVDIRSSVAMTEKVGPDVMSKIYTAFIKSVIKIGRHHNGSTRNIIGDRVMLVFPSEGCFTNAISCAISINHMVEKLLAERIEQVSFKCGIGIDYGVLRVIKVGIQRNGNERSENKGLVWTGKPANLASRLTDFANKTIKLHFYEVTRFALRNPNPFKFFLKSSAPRSQFSTASSKYLTTTETIKISVEDFAGSFGMSSDGEIINNQGKLVNFKKVDQSIDYPAILITERVYDGLKNSDEKLVHNYWKEQKEKIKNMDCKVYGCSLTWKI